MKGLVARLRAAGCVYAEDEARLITEAAVDADDLDRLVRERIDGAPLEHLLGWAEFDGLRVILTPGVFVPRQRSVLLVDLAVVAAGQGAAILDLCCGSGALGAAIARRRPDLVVWASDADTAAAECARLNLPADRVLCGDLFAPVPDHLRGRFEVIVANAPYVPSSAIGSMPREARAYEPLHALDGGADGVDLHRRIAAEARGWLAPGGVVLIETSELQVEQTAAALVAAGFETTAYARDETASTVVGGIVPTNPDR